MHNAFHFCLLMDNTVNVSIETVRTKMFVLCLLVLVWLGNATGDDEESTPPVEQPPAVDETPASLGHFPFLALVWFADKAYCAGTILSDRWVLTLAQCCIEPGVSCRE